MHIFEIFIIEFSYTFDLKSYFLNCAKWFSPKYYIDVLYSKWTLSLNRVELMEHRTRAPLLIWPWKVYLRFSSSHLPNNSNDPCELWGLRNCQSKGVNVKKLCTYYEECRSVRHFLTCINKLFPCSWFCFHYSWLWIKIFTTFSQFYQQMHFLL